MADTKLQISSTGRLELPEGSALYYDDTHDIISRGTEAMVYRAHLTGAEQADYAIRIAHSPQAIERLRNEYQFLLDLGELTSGGVPPVALANHSETQLPALVMPLYETSLAATIQQDIKNRDFLKAEQIAVQAAIEYTETMDGLRQLQPPRSCINHKTDDFFINNGQLFILDWQALVDASSNSFASEVSLFGQVWHALFMERYGNRPLYPFNDERWQSPHITDMPEGVVSLGLRVIIADTIQTPPERRFVNGTHLQHSALRDTLQCWQRLIQQSAAAVTVQGIWALTEFVESLPEAPDHNKQEAIWHDLVWRVNLQDGLVDSSLRDTRNNSIKQVQTPYLEPDPALLRQANFVATGEYPVIVTDITTPDSLQQFKDAVLAQDYDGANWLYHHILREASSDIERDWIQRELAPYVRYMEFMLHYGDTEQHTGTPLPVIIAAAEPVLNDTRIDDKKALYTVIIDCAKKGYAQLETAIAAKTWDEVQAAQGAYRIFVSGSRPRAVIDRIRPLYPDEIPFWELETKLAEYEHLHKLYVDLFRVAQTDPLRRLTQGTQTGAVSRQQAGEILQMVNRAVEAGIDMGDIVANNEETRQQWQKMIDHALRTLEQIDNVKQDMDTLRAGVERADKLAADVETIKTQLEGVDGEGLIWAVADLSKRLNDYLEAPGDTRDKLTQDVSDIRSQIGLLDDKLNTQSDDLKRLSDEKLARVQRLLDDVKDRFDTVEGEIQRSRQHEAGVLRDYLDWTVRQPLPSSIEGVLEMIDELVYALRRCPVDAYEIGVHNAWLGAFNSLKNRFLELSDRTPGRLRGRRRRKYADRRQRMAERLNMIEDEAIDRYQAYLKITGGSEA